MREWYVVLTPSVPPDDPVGPHFPVRLLVAGPEPKQLTMLASEAVGMSFKSATLAAVSFRDMVNWSVRLVKRTEMEKLFIENALNG